MKYLALLLLFTLHACCTGVMAQTYIKGPALVEGVTSTATAGGSTTLTKDSQTNQFLTGTLTHTIVLPDATTLPVNRYFVLQNKSTQVVQVNLSGGAGLTTLQPDTQSKVTLLSNGSIGGTWNVSSSSGGIVGVVPVDKGGTGLDGSAAPNGSLLIGNGTGYTLDTLDGTTDQVNVTNGVGSITLSLPQSIATTSNPSFNNLSLAGDLTLTGSNFNSLKVGQILSQKMATGLIAGGILAINANPALFDLPSSTVEFLDYSVSAINPTVKQVACGPFTAQTITNLASADSTYISLSPSCAIIQSTTFPTPQQRRTNAFIGRLSHPNHTSLTAATTLPDFLVATDSQLYDLFDAIGAFNISGNVISPNGANLSFNKSAGSVFRRSGNYATNNQNPNVVSISGTTPSSFLRATQTTINATPTTLVDVANYDVAGTVTTIPGGGGTSTNRRIYLFSNGTVGVQYGQVSYASLANAISGISTEAFVINPQAADGGILLAILSCRKDATDLSNTAQCQINRVGRFDQTGVTTGSLATTTLQQAYLNSVQPQITLTSTALGLQVRDASTPIGSSLFAVQNNGATTNYLSVDVNGVSTTNFVGTGTTGAVRLHNLTTTQRNALTGAAGMMVYDTTLGQFFCYGTAWGPCGSKSLSTQTPTGGAALTIDLTADVQRIRLTPSSAVSLNTTPFGSSAPKDGAEIILVGTSDTFTVTIVANDAPKGVVKYSKTLGRGDTITYIYSATDDRYYILATAN